MTTESAATPKSRLPVLPGLVAMLLVANLAVAVWSATAVRATGAQTDARLTTLEHRVRIIGYEATSGYEGFGFHALLDHLQYWAPWLQKGTPGTTDRFFVEDRVQNIVESLSLLPDAYPQIERAFLADAGGTDTADHDEMRKWLMVAAHRADPKRGTDLLARVLEGRDLEVSLRLRQFAASELLRIDKKRAGEVLHALLSVRPKGADGRPGAQTHRLEAKQMYNYIDDYVASGHPDVEKTLVRLLQETEFHETITIQRCVEALGRMKSRQAISRIEKLFWQQAPVPGQVPNPIFRRKCMIAIVDAIGADAVPFLREVDRRESDAGIRAKLNEYKKEFDFSAK